MLKSLFGHSCPHCAHEEPQQAFYAGVSFKMCPHCQTTFGIGSLIFDVFPFVGPISIYTGSYWAILRDFLAGKLQQNW